MNNHLVSRANAMGINPSESGMNNVFGDLKSSEGSLTGLTA